MSSVAALARRVGLRLTHTLTHTRPESRHLDRLHLGATDITLPVVVAVQLLEEDTERQSRRDALDQLPGIQSPLY